MKVLIISHNSISTINNNGKTMLTLFSKFDKDELCQLYVHPSIPDFDKCQSYYRITDKDILRSYFKFKVKGREIGFDEIEKQAQNRCLFENEKDEKLHRNKKNKLPFRLLMRDILWKNARWYNKALTKWIEEQKPTHVFVVCGYSKFLYNIALKISKKHQLPIVAYVCDDYYFVNKPKTILGRLQLKKLQKKTDKFMNSVSQIITICDSLKDLYGSHFNVSTQTVMTGTNYAIESAPIAHESINSLTYMGNIRCDRYISLAKIGRALDKINQKMNTSITLDIYSIEKDPAILDTFNGIESIRLCGFLTGEEFDKKFHECEMLVHTEDFSSDSIDLVKNSVSTKIADSLGSGICLFAFAPREVASMQYLIQNDCAICCDNEENLEQSLITAVFNSNERERVIINAINTARQNHELTAVGNKVKEIFEKID